MSNILASFFSHNLLRLAANFVFLTLWMLRTEYSGKTKSISWLLVVLTVQDNQVLVCLEEGLQLTVPMTMSLNGNIFRVTGPL